MSKKEYHKKKRRLFIIKMAKCKDCEGEGKIECPDCSGEGEVDCTCDVCGDTHKASCDDCDGDGEVNCEECDGTGEIEK